MSYHFDFKLVNMGELFPAPTAEIYKVFQITRSAIF